MKQFFLALMTFFIMSCSVQISATQAHWYFIAPSETTVLDDGNLSMEVYITTEFANAESGMGPYPMLKVVLTNKTNENIYVDLSKSYISRNGLLNTLYIGSDSNIHETTQGSVLFGEAINRELKDIESDVAFPKHYIELAPKSSITLDGMRIFTISAIDAFRNIYKFKAWMKKKYCIAHKNKKVKSGLFEHYDEANSPIQLGIDMVYSFFLNDEDKRTLSALYYANKLLVSSVSTFPGLENKEFNIIKKMLPDYESNGEQIIRIWTM